VQAAQVKELTAALEATKTRLREAEEQGKREHDAATQKARSPPHIVFLQTIMKQKRAAQHASGC
jgi:hypothetical protein